MTSSRDRGRERSAFTLTKRTCFLWETVLCAHLFLRSTFELNCEFWKRGKKCGFKEELAQWSANQLFPLFQLRFRRINKEKRKRARQVSVFVSWNVNIDLRFEVSQELSLKCFVLSFFRTAQERKKNWAYFRQYCLHLWLGFGPNTDNLLHDGRWMVWASITGVKANTTLFSVGRCTEVDSWWAVRSTGKLPQWLLFKWPTQLPAAYQPKYRTENTKDFPLFGIRVLVHKSLCENLRAISVLFQALGSSPSPVQNPRRSAYEGRMEAVNQDNRNAAAALKSMLVRTFCVMPSTHRLCSSF